MQLDNLHTIPAWEIHRRIIPPCRRRSLRPWIHDLITYNLLDMKIHIP